MILAHKASKPRPAMVAVAAAMALMAAGSLAYAYGQRKSATVKTREEFVRRLVAAAIEQTTHSVSYVPGYTHIPYPGGDVPQNTGVCSDVVIRAYRAVGVDLQKEVHEDMAKYWSLYPAKSKWRQSRPDPSIDHRRVPDLMVFFSRKGQELPITERPEDYAPGDLVTWDLGAGIPHIGIVVNEKSQESGRPMIVHNIGQGPKLEDVLFAWKITGHYRYAGQAREERESTAPSSPRTWQANPRAISG